MIHLIGQIFAGLIIGAVARLVIPGVEVAIPVGFMGWLVTALIGIAGSMFGTLIGRLIFGKDKYAAGWIMSILGAVFLFLLVRYFF
ncbi:MAG: GlsB/YeaQ/YmgE family stress response membrane protein [Pyrinomonadaceae bacterium]